jgi:hypothetical protein
LEPECWLLVSGGKDGLNGLVVCHLSSAGEVADDPGAFFQLDQDHNAGLVISLGGMTRDDPA